MIKYLLPPVPYHKANLHAHCTVSDGIMTAEELRDAYRAQGYSILAITDHSVMVEHQDLNREDILLLTGVELEIEDPDYIRFKNHTRERHFCLIGKNPYRQWIPFRDPNPIPRSVAYEASNEIGSVPRGYSPEAFNELIAECNQQGFLVLYCHPQWSMESYPDYQHLEGIWGMEYRNSDALSLGYDENNSQIFEDLLRMGKFVMPVCSDDLHRPTRHGFQVLGGCWNMIGCRELRYEEVIGAMERGDLYASCGPEIHSLTWENGILRLTSSEVVRIQVVSHVHWAGQVSAEPGKFLTGAEFDMTNWFELCRDHERGYLRLILTGADGSYAVTRAYQMKELV